MHDIMDKHAPHKWIPCKGNLPAWVTNELHSYIDEQEYCTRKYNKTHQSLTKPNGMMLEKWFTGTKRIFRGIM